MRLSLRLKLFFVLLVISGATVAGTWLFMQHAFEQGFVSLVQARQRGQVEAVVERLEGEYRAAGGWQRLRGNRGRWVNLLLRARGGGERPPRWARRLSRSQRGEWPPRRAARHERDDDEDDEHPPRPRRLPLEFRMMLLDERGEIIFGRADRVSELELNALRVRGREVGYLGVLPGPALSQVADIEFVEEQKRAFVLIAGVIALLVAGVAFPLAGAMTGRLREIARGARALAAGRFETRVPAGSSDELGRLAVAFNDLAAALEAAEKSRRQWVVDVSHELRTPLAILRAELEALQDGVRALDARAVDALHGDVRRLERLVDDLYDLARSDLGALSYDKTEVDATAVLQADLSAMAGEFQMRGIRVQVETPTAAIARVHADPDRLSQLFRNLLTNAARYTDNDGLLRVRVSEGEGDVLLDFEDSAPGVPDADLPHLFNRFHRVERSRSRALGGAGLGLAICRNIVAAHGGSIEAQHSELGGLRIRVTLPEST